MSDVKQKRHPRRPDQEWLDLIQECRSSGMTDKAWCEMNHIQPSKFYYHICRQPFLAATRAAFSGQSGPYFAASF